MFRNKLSDGRGRGLVPHYNIGQDHLEHLIHFQELGGGDALHSVQVCFRQQHVS